MHCRPIPTAAALSLILATAASAQTTAPAASAATGQNPNEIVQLSAFEVSASANNSYIASEATTGTRVATKIADLPFVVNVVTSEFLNDFDFFDISSNLGYTSSLSEVDTEGNYNLRGFTGIFYLWNGFYRLGLVDRATLDRIEIIKGPNAAIYGQTSPAGILSMITKRPSDTSYEDLELTYGSFKTARLEGHVDTNLGKIGGAQVSNVVDFAGLDEYFGNPYEYQHVRTIGDALQIKFNDHSNLLAEVDWYKKLENTGDVSALFDYNSVTKTYTGQMAPLWLARFSQGGPNERQNRELTDMYSEYENRFTDIWSLRVGGYFYDRHNSEIYNGTTNEFDPALGEIVGISTKPTRTILNEDGGAGQADLLAHWYLFNHAVENKTLLTLDWSENWRFRQGTTLPSTLQKLLPSFQLPGAPVYNTVPDYQAWTVINRQDKSRWDTDGIFAREQAIMLNGKLIVFAGMRHDQVTYNLNFGNQYSSTAPFPIATPGQVQHFVDSAWTPAFGANYKLTPNIALYANYSQSFQATAQSAKLGDQPLPNTRGNGVDYGIKCNFLGDRLNFTVGGYYVTETGLKITIQNPDGSTDSVAAGSQNSRGVESDLTFMLTDGCSILAGFGYVNARLLNEGTDTAADGLRPPNIPVDNGYLAFKNDFMKGPLAGFSIHAGLRYDGVSYPDTTASTVSETTLKIPAYYSVDGGVTYRWISSRVGPKLTHEIGVSVINALNRDYVDVKGLPVQSRGFYAHYKISH